MAEEHKLPHEEPTYGAIGEIVGMLRDAAAKFPVKSKQELKNRIYK